MTTYIFVQATAVLFLLYTGTAVPPATLAHKEAWIGLTDRYILGANRRLANAKSAMLQENKLDAAGMHVILLLIRTLIGTYLGCCFVQGGWRCSVLCSRFNDIHSRSYYCGTAVCCCIRTGTA